MSGSRTAWITAGAALALFLALTPRVPGVGDSAEFTLALALTGVPHPTGYPLYVLFGSPLVRGLHALGLDWVRAAAVWSALGGAVFAGLMAATGARLSAADGRASGLAFLMPAVLIVLHPVTLAAATEAEVHTWWYAWCAGAAWFALGGLRRLASPRGEPAGKGRGSPTPWHPARDAFVWGALCGAGLAHHVASALFAVPLTAALAIAAVRSRAVTIASTAAFVLGATLPLASYGFVAWRAFHPALTQWPVVPSLHGVIAHVRGDAYRFFLGGWAPSSAQLTQLQTTVLPLLVPGLLGVGWLALRDREPARRAWFAALLAAALLLIGFVLRYGVPDPVRYFLPALMVAALAAAPAFAALESRAPRPAGAALFAALVVIAALGSGRNTVRENLQRARAEARVRAGWLAIPFERAIVMWWDDDVSRLRRYQLLDGERPGLYLENPNHLTWPGPRRAFHNRFGFDPFAGFAIQSRADLGGLTDHLRTRAPVPVMDFTEVLVGEEPGGAGAGR